MKDPVLPDNIRDSGRDLFLIYGIFNLFTKKKLDSGLLRTREGFLSRLGKAITGKTIVDDEVLDKLEETTDLRRCGHRNFP